MLDEEITDVKRGIAEVNGSIASEYDKLGKLQRRLAELEARGGSPHWTLDERGGPNTAVWKRIDGLTVPRSLVVFRSNGVGISEMEVIASIDRKYRIRAATRIRYPGSWIFWSRVRWFFSYQRAPTLNLMLLMWKVCLLSAAVYLIVTGYEFLGCIVGLIAVGSSLVESSGSSSTSEEDDEDDEDDVTVIDGVVADGESGELITLEETMRILDHRSVVSYVADGTLRLRRMPGGGNLMFLKREVDALSLELDGNEN